MAKKRCGGEGDVGMAGGVRTAKVAPNLKRYREAAQFTQHELGCLLGHKNGAQVCAWEAGTRVPTLELTLEMAAQLGVSTSQLVGEVAPTVAGTPVTNNVVNGEHHTVYQHVEGPILMSDDVEARLRKVVEEVVDARCQTLLEDMRRVVREVLREQAVPQNATQAQPPPEPGS
jgi:transcriptional regulator with XRE-family HTH domain